MSIGRSCFWRRNYLEYIIDARHCGQRVRSFSRCSPKKASNACSPRVFIPRIGFVYIPRRLYRRYACCFTSPRSGLERHTPHAGALPRFSFQDAITAQKSTIMASKLTAIEADELLKQGQDLYRQKKYQAALQRFNAVCCYHGIWNGGLTRILQVLKQDLKPPLTVLDSRAATHAKLADLQAALRDGRRMIEEYKTSCSVCFWNSRDDIAHAEMK